ncbi:MAG: hypothetical protein EBY83_09010, partial [Verrucomicrobia bacterium]|nr:hypothetical protein [Verrucomicrobiota bacterium]
LNATLQSAQVSVPAPQEVPPAPKSRPKADKAEAPVTATSESGATTATLTADAPVMVPSEVTYDMVAKAITDTFPKDRAKVLAALAKFGAAKGPQLKPADYAAFLAELA